MSVCLECNGHGLVRQDFSPNPMQPNVRRTEVLRCPDCGGMGVIYAREQTELHRIV